MEQYTVTRGNRTARNEEKKMGNTKRTGFKGGIMGSRQIKLRRASSQFPAGPNQEQHEWEEPRVVEVKPKLGRTDDGVKSGVDPIANRVDRLRLLGNGVVPDTCERAIRILLEEVHREI